MPGTPGALSFGVPRVSSDGRYYPRYPNGDRPSAAFGASVTDAATAPTGIASGAQDTPGAHPRLLVTSSMLTRLRAAAVSNTAKWQTVKAQADEQIARGSSVDLPSGAIGESADFEDMSALALAYLCSPDNAFKATCITRASALINALCTTQAELDIMNRDVSYDFREAVPALAQLLDWCYAGLSTADKQKCATFLGNMCDRVWVETTVSGTGLPSRAGSWGVNDPFNNYFAGFLHGATYAAIAAYGDDTAAAGSNSVSNPAGSTVGTTRAKYHCDLVRRRWADAAATTYTDRVHYSVDTGGTPLTQSGRGWFAGGFWGEGTNYDPTQRLAPTAFAFYTGLGATQYINEAVFPLVAAVQLQVLMPGLTYRAYAGDQALDSVGGCTTLVRSKILWPSFVAYTAGTLSLGNFQAALYAASQMPVPTSGSGGTAHFQSAVDDFLLTDPAITPAADLTSQPLSSYDAFAQFFIRRTNWTNTATLDQFQSGPLAASHQLLAPNHLQIWKGGAGGTNYGWLIAHGAMVDSNVMPDPGAHGETYNGPLSNAVLTSDDFPVADTNNVGCSMINVEDVVGSYFYIASQAKLAYYTRAIGQYGAAFTDCVRKEIGIDALDARVVVDRGVKRLSATQLYRRWYHWRSVTTPIAIAGNAYSCGNREDSATISIKTLTPSAVLTQGTVTRIGTMNYVTEECPAGSGTDFLTTAMRVNNTVTATLIDDAQGIGAIVNGYEVRFGRTEVARTTLTFTSAATATDFILTDMTPSHSFTITENGGNSQSVSSSAQGVLKFHGALTGARTVAVT